MRINLKYIIIFIFINIFFSCSKNENRSKKESVIINFDFPDTVEVNNYYTGKIQYNSPFDTITVKLLHDTKRYRKIFFSFTGTKKIFSNPIDLKSNFKDTIYAKTSNLINIDSIYFGKTGTYFFDGIIFDEVNFEIDSTNTKGKKLTRILSKEYRVIKKVIVVRNKLYK